MSVQSICITNVVKAFEGQCRDAADCKLMCGVRRTSQFVGKQSTVVILIYSLVLGIGVCCRVNAGVRITYDILNRNLDCPVCIIASNPVTRQIRILRLVVNGRRGYQTVAIIPTTKRITRHARSRQSANQRTELDVLRRERVRRCYRTFACRIKIQLIYITVIVNVEDCIAVRQNLAVGIRLCGKSITIPPSQLCICHGLQILIGNILHSIRSTIVPISGLIQIILNTIYNLSCNRFGITCISATLSIFNPVLNSVLSIRTSRPMRIQLTSGNASLITSCRSYLLAAFSFRKPTIKVIAYHARRCQFAVNICICTHLLTFH